MMHISYVKIAAQHAPIKEVLLDAIGKVIDKGQFILGDEVAEFETRFAELCGVRYAVGLNSGTDALILALRALGIGPGDEVITAPNSFVASASCIALVGARPVFVDVNEDYNINPALIEDAITSHTRAIIPVHLTGRPADMDVILKIAQKRSLYVIEDCAQAVAAEYKGKRVGGFGIAGCFSLHPLKTLNACGDGGVLTTNDNALAERIKILRNAGLKSRDECISWSGHSRLDNIQAAILLVKLNYLDTWTEKRRANALFYQQQLADLQQLKMPQDASYERAVYHTFVIQADCRNELKSYLSECGIETAIHYPVPIHLDKAAEKLGYVTGSFPVTEWLAQRILSLPVYPELTAAELNYIVETIKKYYLGKV
ncbi:MAG: DegT/DnrJ/EryC1/StrS family aminotransferase [Patescibacteria group bacterium]